MEALRLGHVLYQLMPHPEVGGLLALMLLHAARREARTARGGSYVPINSQDRGKWNAQQMAQGKELLLPCLGRGRPGPFQIQAAISAVHSDARTSGATDWEQIAGPYTALSKVAPSAVVTLNRSVALANAESPQAGLDLLESVAEVLDEYQPLHAARADLLKPCGRLTEARSAYQRAIDLSANDAERGFLIGRLSDV